MNRTTALAAGCLLLGALTAQGEDIFDRVEHRFASNDGVRIHYVTLGQGPVLLFVHGFPDFWYTWRQQMAGLSDKFKCAAMDLRGYNESDKPEGVENYTIDHVLADVTAVIRDLGEEQVTLVGHDWGGSICWRYAIQNPETVKRLIILNLTHPKGYANVILHGTELQQRNTQYARNLAASPLQPGVTGERFARAAAGGDPTVAERYATALTKSSHDAMVNYYRANGAKYDRTTAVVPELPNLACPVLQFHGLKDTAVDKDGLIRTWDWIDKDYTLVTFPEVGHWVQRDAAERVTTTMSWWLRSHP